MSIKFLKKATCGLLGSLSFCATISHAQADEGLARITNLGDRAVVAESQKARAKPKSPSVYKAVEDENPAAPETQNELFKGQPLPHSNDLFFGAGLDYFDNFGIQGRYAVRIMDKGFLPEYNDPFYIEGGAGLTFYGTKGGQTGVTGFDFLAAGRWDFEMNPTLIFFGELGIGYNVISNNRQDFVRAGGWFPVIGVGAMINFSDDWALRADVSYEFLGAGLTHRF